MKPKRLLLTHLVLCFCIFGQSLFAQTTEFTFQGSLKDGAATANGNYDFEFALFDAVSAGSQIGVTIPKNNVPVANGIFAVKLDFGYQFSGADRFLEIRVRPAGQPGITILGPRQLVNSSPYSVKSLNTDNAAQLGGVAANQYVVTTDPRMTDARPPTAGSSNYVQNGTTTQAASNFNVSGTGTASIVNATTQYNLNGSRILSNPGTQNLFAGVNAGTNTTGSFNAFFGRSAGQANTTGAQNAFFGSSAGFSNTTGAQNAFFGEGAGYFNTTGFGNAFMGTGAGSFNTEGNQNAFFGESAGNRNTIGVNNAFVGSGAGFHNTTGTQNAFLGASAGFFNTIGANNAFFGASAGQANTDGNFNAFFGRTAGVANTTGVRNAFFGADAGSSNLSGVDNAFVGTTAGNANVTGSDNTIVGVGADVLTGDLTNASAFGRSAAVGASNSLVLGSINGVNGAAVNTKVGIGSAFPIANLHVQNGGTNAGRIHVGSTGAGGDEKIITFGDALCAGSPACVYIGERTADDVMELRAATFNFLNGLIQVNSLGASGATSLCRNASNQIATCSSSLRYKTKINPFVSGLSFVNKLRPISFDWKDGGMKDVGFGAEDVAEIDPRFVTYNDKGEVEGVKYDRLSVAFVNAFREQQAQIEAQQKQNEQLQRQVTQQQAEIDALKALACLQNPNAEICKPQK